MKVIFSAFVLWAMVESPFALAASTVYTSASLLCEEPTLKPAKIRIALIGRGSTALLLSHTDGQDADSVLHSERIGANHVSETALRTTIKVDGVFEWVWIRKPGAPGYKGTLELYKSINGLPVNTPIKMDCSIDSPFTYNL